uniref:PH domain-containing protein n=1 Tax=Amphimedon queenslandica TaxID=400682 RepID=A0A1X7T4D5_AMPQE
MYMILEYTPNTDPDYESLLMALQASETLCSQVNDGVRAKENAESLEWLQSHKSADFEKYLRLLPKNGSEIIKLIFNSQTNFMGSRKLLHWGKFTK